MFCLHRVRAPGRLARAMKRWVCALGVLLALPASAPAVTNPSIHVQPTAVSAGHRVHVYGRAGGCPQGDRVTLISRAFRHTHDFAGLPAVFTPVRAGDRYSVRVRIPSSKHGRYTISARCGGGSFGVTAQLRVR
jgi:hypothetical protein